MIALGLLLALVTQDTTGLPPRARAMLDRFPVPRGGEVSIATRFSTDTAWIGEQVELVTAAWFPRELRNRLRHTPNLLPPALSGLWSVQAQANMSMASTRVVGGQLYDLFVAHQTLFPLGGGKITVPPAVLTYSVPASLSFFAPEQRKTLSSRPATLVIRPIPSRLAATLGSGPTARGIRVTWQGIGAPIHAGTPALLELILSGEGNIALWPAPELTWPPGMRVYPDRTEERAQGVNGRRGGEKRFRFTVVADSQGVLSLPRVRYPYFDPVSATVQFAAADPVALVVLPGSGPAAMRRVLPIADQDDFPVASLIVARGWLLLLLLALLPLAWAVWQRRRRPAPAVAQTSSSPEVEFQRLLGNRGDASPEAVVAALRHHGVPRDDAEGVRAWLAAASRRRYGPPGSELTPPPAPLTRVLQRLRRARRYLPMLLLLVGASLRAQSPVAGFREYEQGNYAAAAESFGSAVRLAPLSVGLWRNLATARWLAGDDVGAAAAWIHALELAPRDPVTREEWHGAGGIPGDVRDLAPVIPVSRDELLLLALGCWLLTWLFLARRSRRTAAILGLLTVLLAGGALARTREQGSSRVLLRVGATLRLSPHPVAPVVGTGTPWSVARVIQVRAGWLLVSTDGGQRGWLPQAAAASLGPLDSPNAD
ncbi:MAG: BatD family protein [Gemmatimonadota bacterium]